MCLAGRQIIIYIYNENPPAEVGGLQRRLTCWPREITHVVPECAIFVKDFRVPETEILKVQWGGSRASILAGLKSGYCLARLRGTLAPADA